MWARLLENGKNWWLDISNISTCICLLLSLEFKEHVHGEFFQGTQFPIKVCWVPTQRATPSRRTSTRSFRWSSIPSTPISRSSSASSFQTPPMPSTRSTTNLSKTRPFWILIRRCISNSLRTNRKIPRH